MATDFRISLFQHKQDNQPCHVTMTWAEFCAWLAAPEVRAGKDGALFSPATFKPARRAKANVQELGLLVLDYDHAASLADDPGVWERLGVTCALYTSHSHGRMTESNPVAEDRFRLVIPLAEPIPARSFPALWDWAYRHSGGKIDRAAKDASRIYYRPAKASDDAPYAWHVRKGAWLDWRALALESEAARVLEAERQLVTSDRTAYGEAALRD